MPFILSNNVVFRCKCFYAGQKANWPDLAELGPFSQNGPGRFIPDNRVLSMSYFKSHLSTVPSDSPLLKNQTRIASQQRVMGQDKRFENISTLCIIYSPTRRPSTIFICLQYKYSRIPIFKKGRRIPANES
ncbi:hypothetical protein CEXT_283511 [Caerostris extrusa]|uniref:Uncharacterized protein n=1 Tax=Caerostris extrusa TaxID=172846 RepID=A0AAV4WUB5_CAEEX|nr:hypothetical protein CEXT_283511 [Caerostris extrusa]